MYQKGSRKKNGPLRTFVFIDDDHKDLFDRGKISLEEATTEVIEEPYLELVTQYQARQLVKNLKNYIYPEAIKPSATKFLIIRKDDTDHRGEVTTKRYLYTYQLLDYVLGDRVHVYITNS